MMPTTTPPKGRPTPKRTVGAWRRPVQLVDALGRAGWGDLAPHRFKGARAVLTRLASVLDVDRRAVDGRGVVVLTVAELAERTGYSYRWTWACVRVLAGLDVVWYTPGAVIDGRPLPSRFELNRRKLGQLVAEARPAHDEAVRARRELTAARLRELGARYLIPAKYRRRSEHVEVAAYLSPSRGGVSTPHPPRSPRAVDEHGVTLAESARLAVTPKNEPATPASPDNDGSAPLVGAGARELIRAQIARAEARARGELPRPYTAAERERDRLAGARTVTV